MMSALPLPASQNSIKPVATPRAVTFGSIEPNNTQSDEVMSIAPGGWLSDVPRNFIAGIRAEALGQVLKRSRLSEKRSRAELTRVQNDLVLQEVNIENLAKDILKAVVTSPTLSHMLKPAFHTLKMRPEILKYQLAWPNRMQAFALVRSDSEPNRYYLEYSSGKKDKALSRLQIPLIIDESSAPEGLSKDGLHLQIPSVQESQWPMDRIRLLPDEEQATPAPENAIETQFLALSLPQERIQFEPEHHSKAFRNKLNLSGKIIDLGFNRSLDSIHAASALLQEVRHFLVFASQPALNIKG